MSCVVTTSVFYHVSGQMSAANVQAYWIGLHDRNGEGIFEWLDEKNMVRNIIGPQKEST